MGSVQPETDEENPFDGWTTDPPHRAVVPWPKTQFDVVFVKSPTSGVPASVSMSVGHDQEPYVEWVSNNNFNVMVPQGTTYRAVGMAGSGSIGRKGGRAAEDMRCINIAEGPWAQNGAKVDPDAPAVAGTHIIHCGFKNHDFLKICCGCFFKCCGCKD